MQPIDPTGLITLLSAIPGVGPYIIYLPVLFALCKAITVFVPPPVAGSRWVVPYEIISRIALNRGYAANATVPGMQAEVRDASITAAKQVAAAPELATVAAIKAVPEAVIAPGVK